MANAPAARQALAVLRLLARHTEPVPASAIARDLGLPRSSVYHLLTVLCDQGFVVHLADERRYGLGVAAFELGSAYGRQAPLQRLARQLLVRQPDSPARPRISSGARDMVAFLTAVTGCSTS